MALQIGDKVKFLNEAGGGVITQLIDKDTVMVLSEVDDFEIPVQIRELISLENKEKVVDNTIEFEQKHERIDGLKKTAVLFVPEKSDFECYIYNSGDATLVFGFFEEIKNEVNGVFSGMIPPKSVQKIETYSLKDIDRINQWRLHGFYFERQPKSLVNPLNYVIKIQSKKLFSEGNKKFVHEIGKEAIIHALEGKEDLITLKANDLFESVPELKKAKTEKVERQDNRDVLEIDLHIHELLDDTRGMSSGEMLEYQMAAYRKVLDENKKYKGKKIILIHGIGNGVLKQRIRHDLQKYPRYVVQDASFQEYGWGATMVIIK